VTAGCRGGGSADITTAYSPTAYGPTAYGPTAYCPTAYGPTAYGGYGGGVDWSGNGAERTPAFTRPNRGMDTHTHNTCTQSLESGGGCQWTGCLPSTHVLGRLLFYSYHESLTTHTHTHTHAGTRARRSV
jgi:hypothetical protein